jgi:hypothetical protein
MTPTSASTARPIIGEGPDSRVESIGLGAAFNDVAECAALPTNVPVVPSTAPREGLPHHACHSWPATQAPLIAGPEGSPRCARYYGHRRSAIQHAASWLRDRRHLSQLLCVDARVAGRSWDATGLDLDASFLPRHLSERNRPRFYQDVPLFRRTCISNAHEAVRCSSGGWGRGCSTGGAV